MQILKRISLVILILFYLAAGINHFRSPDTYMHIIPPYIPYPILANTLAGCFELLFAVMMTIPKIRKFAAFGIILMLITFLPVHISMIRTTPLQLGSLTVTPIVAWVRLLIFQPLLILWAWWHGYNAKA